MKRLWELQFSFHRREQMQAGFLLGVLTAQELLERSRAFLDRPHPSGSNNHGSFSGGEPSEQGTS